MATEKVTEMTAGYRLDVLVAVRVLGWTPWLQKRGAEYTYVVWQQGPGSEPWKAIRDGTAAGYTAVEVGDIDTKRHVDGFLGALFAPSRDIAHAWRVVDRLVAEGWHVELSREQGTTRCMIWNKESGVQHSAQAGPTPLAICRASLLAKP